jgi:23S rRNA pseudouridine2605 synthase
MDNQDARIQKVLSDNGILSRRKAEDAIREGRVKINGHPALIGQKVNPRRDVIAVDGEILRLKTKKRGLYIMLNKPRGYVTTTSDELGRSVVTELVENAPDKVYPVGRLDKNSEGLLLFTNDGEFANMVMHPSGNISKTYRCTVRPDINENQLVELSSGVVIDGGKTLPAAIHVLDRQPGRVVLQITIHEGRNRQIRKMCEAVGLTVARLKRTSVGPVKLGMLKPGEWRELTAEELNGLRGAAQKAIRKADNKDK